MSRSAGGSRAHGNGCCVSAARQLTRCAGSPGPRGVAFHTRSLRHALYRLAEGRKRPNRPWVTIGRARTDTKKQVARHCVRSLSLAIHGSSNPNSGRQARLGSARFMPRAAKWFASIGLRRRGQVLATSTRYAVATPTLPRSTTASLLRPPFIKLRCPGSAATSTRTPRSKLAYCRDVTSTPGLAKSVAR